MISIKKIFQFLFLFALTFFVSHITFAAWTFPTANPPVNCLDTTQPGCALPINVSNQNQIKAGSFGVSNTLMTFGNFFASSTGVGKRFQINQGNSACGTPDIPGAAKDPCIVIRTGSALDLDGQISIRGGGPLAGAVLTSVDTSGLASWQNGFWRVVSGQPADIENGNTGTVYFNNSLAKKGSTVTTGNQINLGAVSTTQSLYSTVGGGQNNQITSTGGYETIGGGRDNTITNVNTASVIGGGEGNSLAGAGGYNTIGGGQNNQVFSGSHNTILGGLSNEITGSANSAVILGGDNNETSGDYSLVAGHNMVLGSNADGTFIWGNSGSALSPSFNTPNSFVIFPNTASAKVSIATTSTTHTLNVDGTVKISSTTVPALEINGQIKITGGGPGVGRVLTDSNGQGLATWEALPLSGAHPGEAMYLKNRCAVTNACLSSEYPASCPSGWTQIGAVPVVENSGSAQNWVRTCYRSDITYQVMYLRSRSTTPSNNCPAGWTEADYKVENDGGVNSQNNVRTCYIEY